MRKIYKKISLPLLMVAVGGVGVDAFAAERLLTENFEYEVGSLYGNPGWLRYGQNDTNPIKVVSDGLTFPGYLDEAVGNKVEYGKETYGDQLVRSFNSTVGEGAIYFSFLINAQELNYLSSGLDRLTSFMGLTTQGMDGLEEGSTPEIGLALYLSTRNRDESKYHIDIKTTTDKSCSSSRVLHIFEKNQTYLVVVEYEIVEGADNDRLKVWVNPVFNENEVPEPQLDVVVGSNYPEASLTNGGFHGLYLSQSPYNTVSKIDSRVQMDGFRVAQNWNDLFVASSEEPPVTPPAKEGDELVLDDSNPYSYYTYAFEDAEAGVPLAASGWRNVALTGYKAWQGGVADGIPCAVASPEIPEDVKLSDASSNMLLVTPALSYSDAESKNLQFRLMAEGLTGENDGQFNVGLVSLEDGNAVVSPLKGFVLENTSSNNGQWVDYEINMEDEENVPSTFFIGFQYISQLTAGSPVRYNLADLNWSGSNTIIPGLTAEGESYYRVYNFQGINVMNTLNAGDFNNLPKGMYIINGKKVAIK